MAAAPILPHERHYLLAKACRVRSGLEKERHKKIQSWIKRELLIMEKITDVNTFVISLSINFIHPSQLSDLEYLYADAYSGS